MNPYGYNRYSDPDLWEILTIFFTIIVVCIVIVAIVQLALYIFRNIGVMALAARQGISNPWLTWIPIVGVFTLGAVADDISARQGGKTYYRFLLLGGNVLTLVIGGAGLMSLIPFLSDLPYYLYSGYYYDSYSYAPTMLASQLFSSLSSILSLALLVVTAMALYRVFKCYHPQNATVYLVLGILFGVLQAIFLFTIRKRPAAWEVSPYGYGGHTPPPYSGYPPSQGGYTSPSPDGYPPSQGGYAPPSPNGYPPAAGGYAPPSPNGYPPPPPTDYAPPPGGYPPYPQQPLAGPAPDEPSDGHFPDSD